MSSVVASVCRACARLMVFGVVACSPATPEQFHWRLDLTSTGGIGGRGDGQVVMTSDGKVVSSRSGGTCEVTLSADELRAIQQAVGAVAPGNWEADYQPPKLQADRVNWHLDVTLEAGDGPKRSVHADWHEDAMNQLPPDLGALALVAERVLDGSIERCRGG